MSASSVAREIQTAYASQSAKNGKSNLNSPNLAPFLLLNPVHCEERTAKTRLLLAIDSLEICTKMTSVKIQRFYSREWETLTKRIG